MANLYKSGALTFSLFFLFLLSFVSAYNISHYGKGTVYYIVSCSSFTTESECTDAGCYWYDNLCHDVSAEVYGPGWGRPTIVIKTIEVIPKYLKSIDKAIQALKMPVTIFALLLIGVIVVKQSKHNFSAYIKSEIAKEINKLKHRMKALRRPREV